MSADEPQDTRGTGDGKPSPLNKRRPPNPREQARRKAWAEFWGKPGQEWKRRQLAKKGKL